MEYLIFANLLKFFHNNFNKMSKKPNNLTTQSSNFNKPNAIIPSMPRLTFFDHNQVPKFGELPNIQDNFIKKQNLNFSEYLPTTGNYFEEMLNAEKNNINVQNKFNLSNFENLNGN